jgi:hypothetical protein
MLYYVKLVTNKFLSCELIYFPTFTVKMKHQVDVRFLVVVVAGCVVSFASYFYLLRLSSIGVAKLKMATLGHCSGKNAALTKLS